MQALVKKVPSEEFASKQLEPRDTSPTDQKMKILMIAPYLADVYGGPSKAVKELTQGLAAQNIHVDLLTTNASGDCKLTVPLNRWIEKEGYRVRYFNCLYRYDSILSTSLCRWLSQHASDYDIVHTHTVFAPTIAISRWVCRRQGVPYVVTPHGMLEPWALSYKASKKRLFYRNFEIPALKAADVIHVLNQQEERNVHILGFQQTAVISNGIHFTEFENLPQPDYFYQKFPQTKGKKIVLFLGRIDPKKGLDLLAPAFSKVHRQFPNTHLVIAGPDSIGFLPTAKNYFEQEDCLEAITFTGMLSGALKYSALSAASVYVSPSYSEGFSMSILEGMAAGLPCVITEKCNFPESAAAKAAYVVQVDAQAISAALKKILINPQLSLETGKRARELVLNEYTWNRAAEKLIQSYQTIEQSSPSPNTKSFHVASASKR